MILWHGAPNVLIRPWGHQKNTTCVGYMTMLTQVDLIGLLGIWVAQTIRDVIIISRINQIIFIVGCTAHNCIAAFGIYDVHTGVHGVHGANRLRRSASLTLRTMHCKRNNTSD